MKLNLTQKMLNVLVVAVIHVLFDLILGEPHELLIVRDLEFTR